MHAAILDLHLVGGEDPVQPCERRAGREAGACEHQLVRGREVRRAAGRRPPLVHVPHQQGGQIGFRGQLVENGAGLPAAPQAREVEVGADDAERALTADHRAGGAARLDRLHAKVEGALSALDAHVVRRAEASLELVNSGAVDPATGFLLAAAASESLERVNERTFEADLLEGQHFAGREGVESELTEVLEAEEYFSPGQKGSSAMPHKRNPVLTENLTGLARMYSTLGRAARNVQADARAATVATSMLDYPEYVQGPGRSNTVVMEDLRVLAKFGATWTDASGADGACPC